MHCDKIHAVFSHYFKHGRNSCVKSPNLGKITQSSVFVSKSYCKAFEISLECSQNVPFDNYKRKYH